MRRLVVEKSIKSIKTCKKGLTGAGNGGSIPTNKNILYMITEERRTEPVKNICAIIVVRISVLLLSGGLPFAYD